MNDSISKPVSSKITWLPTLSSDWLMEITWMILLVSLYHQESYVSSISKPSLMMSYVFRLQDANMTIQTSDNKWCHWWCHLENFNPYLSSEWLCVWLFGLKLRFLAIPRDCHRCEKTHGFEVTGFAGMGTVLDFSTPQHTAYPYRGITGTSQVRWA
jgi:hypothetical protein